MAGKQAKTISDLELRRVLRLVRKGRYGPRDRVMVLLSVLLVGGPMVNEYDIGTGEFVKPCDAAFGRWYEAGAHRTAVDPLDRYSCWRSRP